MGIYWQISRNIVKVCVDHSTKPQRHPVSAALKIAVSAIYKKDGMRLIKPSKILQTMKMYVKNLKSHRYRVQYSLLIKYSHSIYIKNTRREAIRYLLYIIYKYRNSIRLVALLIAFVCVNQFYSMDYGTTQRIKMLLLSIKHICFVSRGVPFFIVHFS